MKETCWYQSDDDEPVYRFCSLDDKICLHTLNIYVSCGATLMLAYERQSFQQQVVSHRVSTWRTSYRHSTHFNFTSKAEPCFLWLPPFRWLDMMERCFWTRMNITTRQFFDMITFSLRIPNGNIVLISAWKMWKENSNNNAFSQIHLWLSLLWVFFLRGGK